MQHMVDGRTASDVFTDPQVAKLAVAACRGDEPAVRAAVSRGVDPNVKGIDGVTPLLWAVDCENTRGIEALLEAGADPNQVVGGKFSPTYAAASHSNSKPLKVLLANGGDPNASYQGATGQTALAAALELGNAENEWDAFDALIEAGADINRADRLGKTVVTNAVALSEFAKVEELLERGYNHDLEGLARLVARREINAEIYPEAAAARVRVLQLLRQRGLSSS